jgi:HK97 gp10 family phage protein
MSIQLKMDIGGIEEFRAKIMYLPEDIRRRVYEAMNSITYDIVRRAKELCPVRTGRLMHSIYGHVNRDLVMKVGATAPYAIYQEFGTRYIEPRAFLTQAIMENMPRLAALMRQALELAIKEASKRR